KTGDSIVLIGQGYHGVSAFGLYHVKGIIQHPNPILNKNMLFMPLSLKQEYLSAFGKISSYIILVEDPYMVNDVAAAIMPLLDGSQKLLTWKEMEKALVQQIEGDRASAVIMKGILYMVVGFGMLGTVIMMMAERTRELAVMIAIGMKKFFVSVVLLIESLFIGITGALSGIILSIPVVFFLHKNPINLKGELAEIMLDYGFEPVMYASIHPSIFITQAIVVFFIALIIGLYPVWSISKMKAVEALRG
ncbi:MAG: FtsX-like permease family protein, partial [Bacteroidales bacterium]|nr:FtsX-like permease family protein [Bacteroidales bacterium]